MSQGELMLSASADEEISRIAESLSLSESNTADTVVDDVDEETMKQRTCELRKLVEDCNNLNTRTDDNYMRRYLYSTHWDVPAAFAKLKNLFKLRHENPDFFVTKPLDHYKHYIRSKCKTILPKKDKYGRRVFLIQYGLVDTSLHSIQDLTVMDDAWFEIFFDDVETQKKGMAIIIDSKGYTLKMMKYASPGNMKVLSTRGDYVPSNVYEFHMVNTPALMSGALKMVVPLLSKNVKKGIQFHSNYSTLHSSLGKECIPSQYGGDTELDYNFGLDLMDKNYDLLNEMHKYGWVETENDGKSGSKNKKK